MAERRDRNRRLALTADRAGTEAGHYTVAEGPGASALDALLTAIEARAADAVGRLGAGAFPPAGADRAWLSVFMGLHLVLGRGHRHAAVQAAGLIGELIGTMLERLDDAPAVAEEEEGQGDAAGPVPGHVVVQDGEPVTVDLASLPSLARIVSRRTWQLLRFPEPLVLTGDTPVALWSRPGAAQPYQFGLGTADEVRVPLDPRHALIVARRGLAGEVVRDLSERHARALNRTVAEAAREWMYYHPDSDPLEGVELAPS